MKQETELDPPLSDSEATLHNIFKVAAGTRRAPDPLLPDRWKAPADSESERRFREMVDALPAAIYTTNAEGNLTYANPACAELAGRIPELGSDQWCISWKLYRPDGTPLPHAECPMAEALKEQRPVRGKEIIAERPDGGRAWIMPYPTPLFDEAGQLIGGINMLVDITARKQAEEVEQRQFRQLQVIYRLSAAVARAAEMEEICDAALDGLIDSVGAERASVLLFDDQAVMRFKCWRGLSERYRHAVDGHSPWNPGDADARPLTVDDVSADASLGGYQRIILDEGIHALAFIPLVFGDTVLGKFMVYYNRPHRFTGEELRICETIAGHVAYAIHRTQAEQALRASEGRYRAVVEGQAEMVCRFRPDGTILFVNGAYARARGTTPEALAGGNFWNFVAEQDRAGVRDLLARLSPETPEIRIENRFSTADGERWTLWTNRGLIFDIDGRATEVQSSGIDITDRRRAEEALRESENRLRLVANHIPALVSYVNRDLIYTFNNGQYEEWFGVHADELAGRSIRDVLGEDVYRQRLPHIERALQGETVRFEGPIVHRRLGMRDADIAYVPDIGARGEVYGFYVMAFDITERKQVETRVRGFAAELERQVVDRTHELTASNRQLEAFCYSVSHDLRAPLRTIMSFSQILRKELGDRLDGPAKAHFRRIEEASARSAKLIDALLELSRLSRKELRNQPVDLGAMAREIIDDLRKTHPERRVEFRGTPHLDVAGDPELLRLMLQNLLENAWKFTAIRERAIIEFGVQRETPRTFFVRDNGAGFDMAYADKMFGLFQRLHGELEFPGTGIGLATAQRIIQRHGGDIRAAGRVDHGATFYFSLETSDISD